MTKLTNEEVEVLLLAKELLNKHFDEKSEMIRKFKWLAKVPQVGEEYTKNKNVFDFEEKGLKEIDNEKVFARNTIINIINDNK